MADDHEWADIPLAREKPFTTLRGHGQSQKLSARLDDLAAKYGQSLASIWK